MALQKPIYIVGLGGIGRMVAAALRDAHNPPPVTLMAHSRSMFDAWQLDKTVTVERDGVTCTSTGYSMELNRPLCFTKSRHVESPIDCLVVATKAPRTVTALDTIRHRLRRESSIVFLQNGLGVQDELDVKLFSDPRTRPDYILGVVNHGVNVPQTPSRTFHAVHAGAGSIMLGVQPRQDGPINENTRYLLDTLTRTPVLAATQLGAAAFRECQLMKLAVNAVINPLTALLDSRNGRILSNPALTKVMHLLIAEISLVIRSLPELRGQAPVADAFSSDHIEQQVVEIASKTADNISSMLADVRRGQPTEIDYLNGYIVRRGEEVGINAVANLLIANAVRGKQLMIREMECNTRQGFRK